MRVDGNNVLKVYEASTQAAELCRKGKGPVFMECLTYRLRGHVGPFDNIQGNHTDIRPPEEVAKWKKKDPIKKFRNHLIKSGLFETKYLQKVDSEIEIEVKNAHDFARKSPYPNPDELRKYVFKE